VLVLWRQDDALYSPLWWSDPWFYLGQFRDLVSFKRDLFPGLYYGSRLSWILPGWLAHRLMTPLVANAVMHLGVHTIAVFSLFFTIRRTIGLRPAFLTAMIFSLHPWLWSATGYDYVSGAVIAYYLLAMALLTRAAAEPERKWSLLLAGMAYAGSVYAQLYMVSFAPLLGIYYLGMAWTWQRTPVLRSLRDLCLWPVLGFILFTLPMCVINGLWVDGNFWFWTPSLKTAQAVTTKYIWTETLSFQGSLAPYLWLIILGAAVAIPLLPVAWKEAVQRRNWAAVLFSLQFLASATLMAYLQSRGITLLGHYYYACYLFGPAYLVLAASFWPAAERMSARTWLITCCAATLLFGLFWISPPSNPKLLGWMPEWAGFSLAGCVLATGLVFRRNVYGTWLSLAGLVLLTSLTYSGSYREVDIHATRSEYLRVMENRRVVEQDRNGEPVTFWYDREELGWHEFYALNASYMAEFARIGEHFPQGCATTVEAGSLVVVTSRKTGTSDLALRALTDCWRGAGVKPVVQTVRAVAHPYFPYTMVVLKAVDDFSLRRPLRVNFDGKGLGRLELVQGPTESGSLPHEMWAPSAGATLERVAGELTLRTPPAGTAYAFTYAPLTVPATGRYRFAMTYKLEAGRIAFGAFPPDESRWLANDVFGRRVPEGRQMVFALDLQAGDTVLLRIANNNASQKATSFVLLGTTVVLLAPPR
jgi:4-amino-4-deoxy-L-arabinose transferase-like glycosyltransferase